ncbi:ATP synthase F1 subunit delta [Natranaerobius thermophilus]|uniref:ATP synthase subunit delta n=1 Tax=Natranaerobius thermophilus (strain ATCC BAA-1301 / DSM 18059 / JW/NM-WN-LF) TaxID=457570 RepID=ATPD_NATTJ|nr:ATP synthase F1 subunit delta [Natranaerobius thermophilus]B2A3G5.1 RecName: Full=ATP synthase subunit delta; AltName: Full=ATP synthase F(1) sector subunit delta; AltName: Full=F-type ATPase subunit delta; Short=F-ATPase subunit delta [Natranaerobius thermophilus JW/NM-WN-LF]ACB86394.1 ATP synthase F1, delta subunit [Natranaerobius thermophilus JW/NM-WN-LF]
MIIPKRYAEALFQLAKEREKINEITQSFNQLIERLRSNEEVFKLLSYPVVDIAEKKQVADELTADLEQEIRDYLKVLIDNKRTDELAEIHDTFLDLVRTEENRTLCEVKTPIPLDEDELKKIQDLLAQMSEGEVEIETTTDESIIGGIVVRIGDRVFDYSLKGQLNSLREQLKKTTITS